MDIQTKDKHQFAGLVTPLKDGCQGNPLSLPPFFPFVFQVQCIRPFPVLHPVDTPPPHPQLKPFLKDRQRGQAEEFGSLTAMFQTAEPRLWMLQLLLWHPEKWETQDVGAKPSVRAEGIRDTCVTNTNPLLCSVFSPLTMHR